MTRRIEVWIDLPDETSPERVEMVRQSVEDHCWGIVTNDHHFNPHETFIDIQANEVPS